MGEYNLYCLIGLGLDADCRISTHPTFHNSRDLPLVHVDGVDGVFTTEPLCLLAWLAYATIT